MNGPLVYPDRRSREAYYAGLVDGYTRGYTEATGDLRRWLEERSACLMRLVD